MNHHDIALVENTALPEPPKDWSMFGMPCAVNHIAIALPDREAWLAPTRLSCSRRASSSTAASSMA